MKIQITAVHDKIALIEFVNDKLLCGLNLAKEKVLNIICNNKPLIIDAKYSDVLLLNKICTFKVIKIMKQNQFEFKPFDKVLVRDTDLGRWQASFYSHYSETDSSGCETDRPHYCIDCNWRQCIPYNENTAHFIGTDQSYTPPQPKEYYVSWGADSEMEQTEYTADEFRRFIETAVIDNKDVSNFMVRRIR